MRVRARNTRSRVIESMQHSVVSSTSVVSSRGRARRVTALAAAGAIALVLAMLIVVAVQANFASFALRAPQVPGGTTMAEPVGQGGGPVGGSDMPFLATAADGHVPEGTVVTLADSDVPAIARLDPALLAAMREAESDAAVDGIHGFQVSSGWRSEAYQRWLLEDAIERYGDESVARRFVATPEGSKHVTGEAIDIALADAQSWLSEHGARYGICQTYANEPWHFELATEPGGVCPEMKADAAA